MSYYVHVDRVTYDGKKEHMMTCTGVSENIVLKILETADITCADTEIYREEDSHELQDS